MVEIEDDGFLNVKIGDAEALIDVYSVYNKAIDINKSADAAEAEGKTPGESLNAQFVRLAESVGLPALSERASVKFAEAIFDHVASLRKKDGSAPSPSPSAD